MDLWIRKSDSKTRFGECACNSSYLDAEAGASKV
jgi:hypothetical protein